MVVQVNDVGMELRAEDLRIGNWVDYNGIHHQIDTITRKGTWLFSSSGTTSCLWSELKPIQLTEEILLKCGFIELPENSEWDFVLNISAAKLYVRGAYGLFYFQFNETYLADIIKSLHQLQNFCSVFGKELNVKF